jgi:Fur family ferric uptake transcriptional regulator
MEKKFLNRFQLESGKIYYELFGEHHHHLVCLRCKQIADVKVDGCRENFEQLFLKNSDFKVLGHSLEFYVICKECAGKSENGKKI